MTANDFEIGETVLIRDHVWYVTRAKVIKILPDKNLIYVRIIERTHRTSGKPGRVGPNEVWRRTPNSLEKITERKNVNV